MKHTYGLIIAILVLLFHKANAQFNIILNPGSELNLKATTLLNADIQSFDNKSNTVFLKGTIKNTTTGLVVVNVVTSAIVIEPGFNPLASMNVTPIFQYNPASLAGATNLPFGSYELCIGIYFPSGVEAVASDCQMMKSLPMSPPMLVYPSNAAEILETYPILNWLPPSPIGVSQIQYKLKLVEILSGQSAFDALQRNNAHFEQSGIQATFLPYPVTALPLERGKEYAWHVSAFSAFAEPIGETEVWSFRVSKGDSLVVDTVQPEIASSYIRLKSNADSYFINVRKVLRLIADERYGPAQGSLVISDLDGKEVYARSVTVSGIGDQFYEIDLSEIQQIKPGERYRLKLIIKDRPAQYLIFKVIEK